ncbi:NmrA-like family protein [Trichoderma gamsii]|uniref:NmrA-like family protein n=1 Tax=Trichoderma gamsii TaxID=398673 RepID=A0A2P4Z7Y1_9HYPO|nr:NmrA-like family protein [Trichoderma gamsii]PON20392.1 NmrA-like family protein [Trichoderma gamsii]
MLKPTAILLVGATGTWGGFVTQALAAQSHIFTRIAVYHNTARPTDEAKQAKLEKFRKSGLEIVVGSGYENPEPFHGFDCVMIFAGNHGLHEQPQIIDSAIAGGVRHFYPSEYGADLLVGDNWNQRYYKYKVMTRQHLQKRAAEYPDLGWTYFVVGRLTEWAIISHFGIDNYNAKASIYGTEAGKQSLIGVDDAVAYLLETLKEPIAEIQNGQLLGKKRTYRISGSSPTYKEIFETLERVTGRRYNVTYLEVESASIEEADAKRREDIEQELAASHKLVQGRQGTLVPYPWDNSRFPSIQPRSVEECLRAAFQNRNWRVAYGLN